MFATLPTAEPAPAQVPGMHLFLTRSDFNRLLSVLRDVETLCSVAFANRQDLLTFPRPLHTAHNCEKLRETLERAGREAAVPATLDSNWTRPAGGTVNPNKSYVVRREIGQYNKLAPVAKWVWTTHDYVQMTPPEFHKEELSQSDSVVCMTRTRIQMLDENGKILRERFSY